MSDYIASYEMPQENVEWLRGVGLNDDWRTTAVQVSNEMVEKAVVGCQKVCTDNVVWGRLRAPQEPPIYMGGSSYFKNK